MSTAEEVRDLAIVQNYLAKSKLSNIVRERSVNNYNEKYIKFDRQLSM